MNIFMFFALSRALAIKAMLKSMNLYVLDWRYYNTSYYVLIIFNTKQT